MKKFIGQNKHTQLFELTSAEAINIEAACKKIDPEANTYTAISHLIEAFANMSPHLAKYLYKNVMEMSGNFGKIIQKTAEEKRISFGEAKYLLITGEMPKEGSMLRD